jgi:hypothetical protein
VPTFTGSSACDRELVKACGSSQGIPLLNTTAGWIYTLNVGVFCIGLGDQVDGDKVKVISPGCAAANTSHLLGEIRGCIV